MEMQRETATSNLYLSRFRDVALAGLLPQTLFQGPESDKSGIA